MSYTPPAYNAASVSWVGALAYTAPAYSACNFTWQPTVPSSYSGTAAAALPVVAAGIGAHGVRGAGAGALPITASGSATYTSINITGSASASISLVASGLAGHGVRGGASASLAIAASGEARHGVAGLAFSAINCIASGRGAHGVAGCASKVVGITVRGNAIHERYELRGEVRESGVLVNRRVRAYLRSTGAMVGEVDTAIGKFTIHTTGTAEHYITPIDLDEFAADWLPPTANRIVPVLAFDAA